MKNTIDPQVLKSLLLEVMSFELTKLPDYLAAVEKPEKKLELIIKLMPFIIPKMGNMAGDDYDWHNQFRVQILD